MNKVAATDVLDTSHILILNPQNYSKNYIVSPSLNRGRNWGTKRIPKVRRHEIAHLVSKPCFEIRQWTDGWMGRRKVGIGMNYMHFCLREMKCQLLFHWQDFHHEHAPYTMLDHRDALRGGKMGRASWFHAVCYGMEYVLMEGTAVHDKGKGP